MACINVYMVLCTQDVYMCVPQVSLGSSSTTPILLLETGSVTERGAHVPDRPAGRQGSAILFLLPGSGITGAHHHAQIYMWALETEPRTGMDCSFPTGPSLPQACFVLYFSVGRGYIYFQFVAVNSHNESAPNVAMKGFTLGFSFANDRIPTKNYLTEGLRTDFVLY